MVILQAIIAYLFLEDHEARTTRNLTRGVIDQIASTPGLLDALADAHARAREQVWKLCGAPDMITIDVDATLISSHSDKEGAAGTFKAGYGFPDAELLR